MTAKKQANEEKLVGKSRYGQLPGCAHADRRNKYSHTGICSPLCPPPRGRKTSKFPPFRCDLSPDSLVQINSDCDIILQRLKIRVDPPLGCKRKLDDMSSSHASLSEDGLARKLEIGRNSPRLVARNSAPVDDRRRQRAPHDVDERCTSTPHAQHEGAQRGHAQRGHAQEDLTVCPGHSASLA